VAGAASTRIAIVLLGPPGAGKGTQARRISAEFNYPAISTGDILREAAKKRTKLGIQAQQYMNSGALVPDDLVDAIVKERLTRKDCAQGFLLDGYPRTIHQAAFLEKLLAEEKTKILAIGIHIDHGLLVARLAGRWTCPNCGKMFNASSNPSSAGDRCDECGTPLVLRKDDSAEVVEERLQVYLQETKPVIGYFQERGLYVEVDGEKPVDQVYEAISEAIRKAVGKKQRSGAAIS